MDFIIRNAHLMTKDGLWNIGIDGENIAAVERTLPAEAAQIDAGVISLPRPMSTATSISTNAISAT